MPSYMMIAKIDQIVTKEVQLLVVAGSEEEAEDKARQALQMYPKPVTVDGVNRMVTNKASYWIPKSIEFSRIEQEKTVA
jgi:two-component SAPR family response regulator